MPAPHIQFKAVPPLDAALAERSDEKSLSLKAQNDLSRYYAVLRDSLSRVNLTEAEASLIVDALNGTPIDEGSYRLLWAEVTEAMDNDGLAEKWNVDGPTLVAKLRALSPGENMAIADACERFWKLGLSTDKALRIVGLVR